MFKVSVDALLTFAQGLVGHQLHTLHEGCPFTIEQVDVGAGSVTFRTSQGNTQVASGQWLRETCDTYSITNSDHPSDYTHTHGVSYTLALIKRFRESQAAHA